MNEKNKIISGQIDVSKVRGLLFDVDGTLSDTDDHLVHRFSNLLKPVTWLFKDRDPTHFARWTMMAAETPANFMYSLADRLGLDAPLARVYNRISRRRHERTSVDERFWMVPGILDMLDHFRGHYPMAVVSARDETT
ncbi:MAG: HAD hydrolase-like protein, partial [Brevefilum sp.]